METHLSRRERKKRETRSRLITEALRLFSAHGYDDTTVEQIAEAADVAKGTFFNYFGTKDAVLPALAEWRLQQLENALLPENGAPVSPVTRIKLALCLVSEDPLTDPLLIERLFAAMAHQHEKQETRPGRVITRLLTHQVRQAQAAGEIRDDLDPALVGGMIRALFFQQMMMWYHGYRPAPLPELLEKTVDLLLSGVSGPAWRQSA